MDELLKDYLVSLGKSEEVKFEYHTYFSEDTIYYSIVYWFEDSKKYQDRYEIRIDLNDILAFLYNKTKK